MTMTMTMAMTTNMPMNMTSIDNVVKETLHAIDKDNNNTPITGDVSHTPLQA
jgi:hypothetical protein